ncbi:MAG TPA: hypothetical protein VM925_07110 [Labilithrix sp.]|nr:hypothetical protein [Labilithrix sp.]
MQPINAVVKNGRLTLNEPSDLPEGHVVALLPIDDLLALADAFDNKGPVTFEVIPAPRQWTRPKALDAAALLDELRSM